MTTLLLLAAAAMLFGGKNMITKAKTLAARVPRPNLSWQQIAAAGLLVAAALSFYVPQMPGPSPVPPEPAPVGPLDLAGLFQGPTAAEDATTVAALTAELADEIAWDGRQPTQYLRTGVAIDTLRQAARELRCRGVSIGARQPAARDAIARHLDDAVGNEGGPIDEARRAAWVKALAEISEAAADVTQ